MTISPPPGWVLYAHDELGSTNDEACRMAACSAPHGTVVTAGRQTAGRGRLGRAWASPPGNAYASVLLRPGIPAARTAELGFVAALAVMDVADAMLQPPHRVRLKWPNDVLLDGAKLAGILTEVAGDAVVVGIGLNVAWAPEGLAYPATCLGAHGPATAATALPLLLQAMGRRTAQWEAGGFDPVRSEWMLRGPTPGATLVVRLGATQVSGVYEGLDESGALLLGGPDGRRRVVAGEVLA